MPGKVCLCQKIKIRLYICSTGKQIRLLYSINSTCFIHLTMKTIIFCVAIPFPALFLTKMSNEGKKYHYTIKVYAQPFLGVPNDSKFRRIYFSEDSWGAVSKNTIKAAERKITEMSSPSPQNPIPGDLG